MTDRNEARAPYKVTPIFDEKSLPAAIRRDHSTKAGVWGLLRILDGEADLVFHHPRKVVRADAAHPAIIPPEAVHHVETIGPVRLQVEFYLAPPEESAL